MKILLAALFAFSLASAGSMDSLTVLSVDKGNKVFFKTATGVWWPEQSKSSKASFPHHAAKSRVVVWFHGGMTSGNCQKGYVAGEGFSKLFPDVVVVSVSACRESHWATENMMLAVDAALDSVAKRRVSFVDEVSLVGVSDGAIGVMVYSMRGKRRVKDRLLVSSFGPALGPAAQVAPVTTKTGRWRFLQGGSDRLYPPHETLPWIQEFCKNVGVDCDLKYDPAGEHDWSYWQERHLDWIREAVSFKK
jgi:pimeloyl-ACP methyl ester carboxylesterase